MKIHAGIIIPVYNVENTVKKVLDSLENSPYLDYVGEVLFVDNDSSDGTATIIQDYLKQESSRLAPKTTLLKNKINYGYGSSIKIGMDYFMMQDVTHVTVIHGDYQVDPHWLLGRLFDGLLADKGVDLVLASRFMRGSNISDYSQIRTLGNNFFNRLTNLCTGLKMSDSGTAMMVVKKEILRGVPVVTLSNSWQFHPQLNILLYYFKNIKIREIPMDWSDSDAKSSIALFNYGYVLLKMLLIFWFKRVVLMRRPAEIFCTQPILKGLETHVLYAKGDVTMKSGSFAGCIKLNLADNWMCPEILSK